MACQACRNKGITNNCGSITIEDFQTYLDKYLCLRDSVQYNTIDMSLDYVQQRIAQCYAAIADKQADPKSCSYQETLQYFVRDFNKILTLNIC